MGIFTGTNNFRRYGYGIELPDGFLPVDITNCIVCDVDACGCPPMPEFVRAVAHSCDAARLRGEEPTNAARREIGGPAAARPIRRRSGRCVVSSSSS